ncbi:Mpo1-like protein [Nitrospirillum sp. BR 11164]|uniref:Mpo1 family 2-hydroxy fatty acid dioxygenase n=1 Tax=Nitrospirillum sp. BR 11164 TaxID=3104324 RepID=UPI002AFE3ED7|nr:Mpo1-like protein [Nitrospirillum sp. BR 11164]MEA1649129.1 Mpo1-like protein [Nitrospirillum sp. BR 11164]
MADTVFERQMAMYTTYHRDRRNKATHAVGIPVIVFSVVLACSLVRLGEVAGLGTVTLGLALSAVVWALWIALNRPVGLALGLLVVPSVLLSDWLVERLSVGAVQGLAGGLFVGGWVLQLLGHVYEGRKPALVDNLFQALIGPMFVATEALVALRLAPAGLHERIERQAALR